MEISEIKRKPGSDQHKRLTKRYDNFEMLIKELKKRDIPSEWVSRINQFIEEMNSYSGSDRILSRQLRKAQMKIIRLIEKELKLVPKNLYRNRWLAVGMSAFGIPFGVAFGVSLGNMAFLGIGIPIGMVVGMAIGAGMDKKASEEGRQLDIDFNF